MKSPWGSQRDGFLAAGRPYKVAGGGNCDSGGSTGGGGDGMAVMGKHGKTYSSANPDLSIHKAELMWQWWGINIY